MTDSVPEEVKKRRLNELVSTFYSTAAIRNQRFIGTHQLVLVEGVGGSIGVGGWGLEVLRHPQYMLTMSNKARCN